MTPLLWIIIGLIGGAGWLEKGIETVHLNFIDKKAHAYYDKTLTHAMGTYALVRGLNAVISVVQASDIAVSPAGIGVHVAAGEILDPLNDLIERFSWVVLAAATSLGIQKALLTIFAWTGLRFILPLAALLGLTASIWPRRFEGWSTKASRLLLLAVAMRFLLPVTALATSHIDRLFLHDHTTQANTALESVAGEAEAPEVSTSTQSGNSLTDKVKRFFKNIGEVAQFEARINQLRGSVNGLIERILDLIVIFALKTLIIPLLLLWIMSKLLMRLLHTDPTEIFWKRMAGPE